MCLKKRLWEQANGTDTCEQLSITTPIPLQLQRYVRHEVVEASQVQAHSCNITASGLPMIPPETLQCLQQSNPVVGRIIELKEQNNTKPSKQARRSESPEVQLLLRYREKIHKVQELYYRMIQSPLRDTVY